MKTVIAHFQSPISKRKRENAVALRAGKIGNRQSSIGNAFTLIELLVVISIIGILAGLSVPVLKNLGKDNAQISAVRQILDDVARARQLAISRHTTVYMVFVPTNFFDLRYQLPNGTVSRGALYPDGINSIASITNRQAALIALTNLIPDQLSGYNFISLGQVGDQPGQHQWHYLSDWQTLPEGSFVAAAKFQFQNYSVSIPQWETDHAGQIDNWWTAPLRYKVNQISGFTRQQAFPFPTAESPLVYLPYIAFDYQGRLISEVDSGGNYHHAYVPLAQGYVSYGMDVNKQPNLTPVQATDIVEKPPGNSTNISYNVIDINPLTGRAELQKFKMQ